MKAMCFKKIMLYLVGITFFKTHIFISIVFPMIPNRFPPGMKPKIKIKFGAGLHAWYSPW
jgi:hypothetical protein